MTNQDIETSNETAAEANETKGGKTSRHTVNGRFGSDITMRTDVVQGLPKAFTLITEPGHVLFQKRALRAPRRDRVDAWVNNPEMVKVEDPMDVRRNGRHPNGEPNYEIVDGRGRMIDADEANRLLEAKGDPRRIQLEAQIRTWSDAECRRQMTRKNIMRDEMSAIDIAEDHEASRNVGVKEKDIAADSGLTTKTVGRYKKLLELDDRVKEAVRNGGISQGKALSLIDLPREKQWEAVNQLLIAKQEENKEAIAAAKEDLKAAAEDGATRAPGKVRKAISYKRMEPVIKAFKKQLKAMKEDKSVPNEDFNVAHAIVQALDYASGGSDKNIRAILDEVGLVFPGEEQVDE